MTFDEFKAKYEDHILGKAEHEDRGGRPQTADDGS